MAKTTRLIKGFYRLLFPAALLILLAVSVASVMLIQELSHPPVTSYIVTPEKYGMFSARASQITEETWQNQDGTTASGWLLRGDTNAPAVVLLHRYGTNRSYLLNLGVKLNEGTNFTVLMPDQRGHGSSPAVATCSFGGCEAGDTTAAIAFLKGLKRDDTTPIVNGNQIGVYGVEMGALAGLNAAAVNPEIKAIALDSLPQSSDSVAAVAVAQRFPFASSITAKLAQLGAYGYFFDGCYSKDSACDTARKISNRKVLLLAGVDAPDLQESTTKAAKCFAPNSTVTVKSDLSPSGIGITNSSIDISAAYDQRIIDFFKESLSK